MSLGNDREFRKKLEKSDNIYADISKTVSKARILSAKYNHKILQSEALTSIIQNKQPEVSNIENTDIESDIIYEYFCYINDKEVCDAVKKSYYKSKEYKNLVYVYNDIKEPGRQSRIRVLTRMLWYDIKSQQEGRFI